MHNENFQADFLKMASATHAPFRKISHPHFSEEKRDLRFKITNRTCRFETCRYFRLPNFKLRLISREQVTYVLIRIFEPLLCAVDRYDLPCLMHADGARVYDGGV